MYNKYYRSDITAYYVLYIFVKPFLRIIILNINIFMIERLLI